MIRYCAKVYFNPLSMPSEFLTNLPEQEGLLLRMLALLTSLLNVVLSRNWLALTVMRLHAYLVQALPPTQQASEQIKLAQLPGCSPEDAAAIIGQAGDVSIETLIEKLEEKADKRAKDVKKAAQKWGKFELVDASYKGESLISV